MINPEINDENNNLKNISERVVDACKILLECRV